ncbi:fructose PTS transporter subunit IIA [Thermophilibacter provencensis]|uniref:PTS sugar transporter subunit IIA n=1 Tax=Thermophilibacter provencensis TaxID=1852386 RepID=UPI002943F44B|nr:fructose PTS transporter subunit IIA [Thermophilibacter provencensis]
MSDFVSASHVVLGCSASTVDDVLKLLSEQAVSFGIASDAEALYEAFKAREAEGTTGMMGGFAIPHAKSDAVTQSAIIVDKFDEGVAWPSMDDMPITCAIALLTPASEAGTTHLQLLSKVAVLLMNEDFRTSVQAADDPDKIVELISAGIAAE